jgi:DNA-directed RNA polymerase sigma subunit (sigma70/sigma32)
VVDPDPAAGLHAQACAVAVRAAVAQLPAPLQEVVVAHAGLDGQAPATFAAIGARLGVTKQRAHQLHGAALAQLADPAHSGTLRQLTGRLTRADYRATLAGQQRQARQRRAAPRARRGPR